MSLAEQTETRAAVPVPSGSGRAKKFGAAATRTAIPAVSGALYEARRKIQPQSVRGTFRTIKWVLLAITLGIYYSSPFSAGTGVPGSHPRPC